MSIGWKGAVIGGLLGAGVGIVLGLFAVCGGFFLMEVYEDTNRVSAGVVWAGILFVGSCFVGARVGHRRAQMNARGQGGQHP